MAGTYLDVPSRRMAYDLDGSRAFSCGGAGPAADGFRFELSAGQRATINNQDLDSVESGVTGAGGIFIIFPELREVDGLFFARNDGGQEASRDTLMVSIGDSDTTNPFGSSWAQAIAAGSTPNINGVPRDQYRTDILSMAETSSRGLATFRTANATAGGHRMVHVYGELSPGQTPDKVVIIDEATGLEFDAPIDYGDVPRGGSEDYAVRFRNESTTLTASNIQYTAQSLGLATGEGGGGGHGWFTYTLPGGSTFSATRQIASIAPETSTGIIQVRRITPATTTPRLFAPRLRVTVDTWS